MNITEYIGMFAKGSLKNGNKFYGRVISSDENILVITGASAKITKFIVINDISEIQFEPVRDD